jgi:DNA-binding NarL/FixJ family response regulator
MSVQELRNAIISLQHPLSSDDLHEWKEKVLALLDSSIGAPDEGMLHSRLSPREQEVMTKLLRGNRLKEIAADLDISVKTVTTHRARLLRKLRVEDNLGLYRYGIRNGLLTA